MLTARDLISRMTPNALAETIASIENFGNLDVDERATVELLRSVLAANVGALRRGFVEAQ